MLLSGIPTKNDYLELESEPNYQELLLASQEFEKKCETVVGAVRTYQKKWVSNPFQQWSRRWEYVYVAQRLLKWAAERPGPLKVADAGSGFTFFPFFLTHACSEVQVECLDNDPTAGAALRDVTKTLGKGPSFRLENLEGLNQENDTVDAVYSVSVIEHTPNPQKVVNEINRILKPGGIFVCTFDISFESGSPMYFRNVANLIDHISKVFDLSTDWEPISLDALSTDDSIVTTGWNSDAVKSGLPWRNPLLVWLYDMLCGRFRSTLYRPLTFCCLTLTKKQS